MARLLYCVRRFSLGRARALLPSNVLCVNQPPIGAQNHSARLPPNHTDNYPPPPRPLTIAKLSTPDPHPIVVWITVCQDGFRRFVDCFFGGVSYFVEGLASPAP